MREPCFIPFQHPIPIHGLTWIVFRLDHSTELALHIGQGSPQSNVLMVRWQCLLCYFLVTEAIKLGDRGSVVDDVPQAAKALFRYR